MSTLGNPGPASLLATDRQGLTDRVYDAIVDLVLDGALPEDSPIRIDRLAATLGVSATPVREALVRLESTGLVLRESYKGYRTAKPLTVEQMHDLNVVRLLLEPEAAHLACLNSVDLVLPELEQLVEFQSRHVDAEDAEGFRKFMRADEQFHSVILRGAGNEFLSKAAAVVSGTVQRWRQFENGEISDIRESMAEHLVILEAFRQGSPDAARDAMRSHLANLDERIRAAGR